ncbi:MAG TPA: hypothetical protein VGF99_08340 [Myxococcota bacterium]
MKNPFAGLDDIPWSTLLHAQGPAADVPANIRALASTDTTTWQTAMQALYATIYHQGIIYGATAPALPYLFDLLDVVVVDAKPILRGLIAAIAAGSGELEVQLGGEDSDDEDGDGDHDDTALAEALKAEGKDLDTELAREELEIGAVQEVISPHLPLLLSWLGDEDDQVRYDVVTACLNHPERLDIIAPAFRAALEQEQTDDVGLLLENVLELLENDESEHEDL